MSNTDSNSIVDLCRPIAAASTLNQGQPGVWSLSQRGVGYTGKGKEEIACLVAPNAPEDSDYSGEMLYPITAAIQEESRLSRFIRNVELRTTKTAGGKTGLLYRKMAFNRGRANSWTTSAEQAVLSSVDQWGQFTADHPAEAYQFDPVLDPPPSPDDLPEVAVLVGMLLADYLIESVDHPVIHKLLKPDAPAASSPHDQEDDNSVY